MPSPSGRWFAPNRCNQNEFRLKQKKRLLKSHRSSADRDECDGRQRDAQTFWFEWLFPSAGALMTCIDCSPLIKWIDLNLIEILNESDDHVKCVTMRDSCAGLVTRPSIRELKTFSLKCFFKKLKITGWLDSCCLSNWNIQPGAQRQDDEMESENVHFDKKRIFDFSRPIEADGVELLNGVGQWISTRSDSTTRRLWGRPTGLCLPYSSCWLVSQLFIQMYWSFR